MSDKQAYVQLAHGSGGTMMQKLISEVFTQAFQDVQLEDAATVTLSNLTPESGSVIKGSGPEGSDTTSSEEARQTDYRQSQNIQISMSTDSFVVAPLFFPGGDIGRLAVCGTVNDVASSGSIPHSLSASFIIEEGFPISDLKRIVDSMARSAKEAGVQIITGDTKVVGAGQADGIYINTTGIGIIASGRRPMRAKDIRQGDLILLSGSLGDHGMCIMSQREELSFAADIKTDAAPLNMMMQDILTAAPDTRCFRDPTRGGLAQTLNELADAADVHMTVIERSVPIKPAVRGVCEMLGYDVFQVANEGKLVAIVPADQAQDALIAMKQSSYGKDAAIIGSVDDVMGLDKDELNETAYDLKPAGLTKPMSTGFRVQLKNAFGAKRVMDTLVGEQLPRIC